jgi:hypothetical protein
MYRTYIAKSKAGHYTVTICPKGSVWPVFKKRGIDSLEGARAIAKSFIDQQTEG